MSTVNYLRCIYSEKNVANVIQDRNKDVEMKLFSI